MTYASLAFGLSFFSTFQKLAVLSNTAVLLLYILCCLAALELKRRDVRGDGMPFGFPGAYAVPVVAIAMILWILTHAKWDELLTTGACLILASILFLVRESFLSRGRSMAS